MKIITLFVLLFTSLVHAQSKSAPTSVTETQCQDFDKVCQEMKSHYSKHYTDPHKSRSISKKSKKVVNYTSN